GQLRRALRGLPPGGQQGPAGLRPLRLPEHALRLRRGGIRPSLRGRRDRGLAVRRLGRTGRRGGHRAARLRDPPVCRLSPQDPGACDDRRDNRGARHGRGLGGRIRHAAGSRAAGQGAAISGTRVLLGRAVALDPANAQAWSDRAYADSLWALVSPSRTMELGIEAARDAGRALDLCKVVSEFWIRRGVGLDMQGRWREAGDDFARALQLAPARADCWYYQAYHLSLSPAQIGPSLEAADHCLRLDPGFLLAQSLRQRLASRLQQKR